MTAGPRRRRRQADAQNRPMYLESSSARNNAYYERFGFEPRKDIFLGRGAAAAVRLTIMVREPKGKRAAAATATAKAVPIKLGSGVEVM